MGAALLLFWIMSLFWTRIIASNFKKNNPDWTLNLESNHAGLLAPTWRVDP
jgi:hypothetical protein